ncbi:hypothetical protein MVEG_11350 [Podila verticillata NRRL 6337]|uniref:Uncharacterized protein n=1 Tax=Podila verticillata NRRL 6337 TaxID=1069443 RepID=A0A086TLJ7_9FUNG|nr:hypothetical protein, variant [Podila verticillata NRRL 6337]KFH62825.1 hypothetical protein MVEG_11350 [Podila verticillata NRRL 6337]
MNTSRPPSRSGTNGQAPVRRAKVASMAQMDISTMSSPMSNNNTMSRPTLVSTNSSHSVTSNTSYSSRPVKVRSSNSTTTIASIRNGNHPRGGPSPGPGREHLGVGGLDPIGGVQRRPSGSVASSSDDGTVSEDSVDDIQLFSGGQAGVSGGINLSSNGRALALSGASTAGSGANTLRGRTRTTTAPPLNNNNSPSMATSTNSTPSNSAKPMRIAAGASIKVDASSLSSIPSSSGPSIVSSMSSLSGAGLGIGSSNNSGAATAVGLLSTSISSSTSSTTSWTTAPGHRNGHLTVDNPTTPPSPMPQQPSHTLSSIQLQGNSGPVPITIRSRPPNGSVVSAAGNGSVVSSASVTASAAKIAEENRRQEEAARTRRKIADLEISNASLLSINSSLEATNRKQAAEIQELKMRMQSAQFGGELVGFSATDLALAQSVNAVELTEAERQDDLVFKRLCFSIDLMICEAKQALDQSTKTGVKVLSSFDMYEKEAMADAEDEDDDEDDDESLDVSAASTPAALPAPPMVNTRAKDSNANKDLVASPEDSTSHELDNNDHPPPSSPSSSTSSNSLRQQQPLSSQQRKRISLPPSPPKSISKFTSNSSASSSS